MNKTELKENGLPTVFEHITQLEEEAKDLMNDIVRNIKFDTKDIERFLSSYNESLFNVDEKKERIQECQEKIVDTLQNCENYLDYVKELKEEIKTKTLEKHNNTINMVNLDFKVFSNNNPELLNDKKEEIISLIKQVEEYPVSQPKTSLRKRSRP